MLKGTWQGRSARRLLLGLYTLVVASCATTTNTTSVDKVELGDMRAPEYVRAYGGELRDQRVGLYVRQVGDRLSTISSQPSLPWRFHVLNSEAVNHFAISGGHVFVTRGLLQYLQSEAELAAVLGVEIGHVVTDHWFARIPQPEPESGWGILEGVIHVNGQDPIKAWIEKDKEDSRKIAEGRFYVRFTPEEEIEASELALRYLAVSGYNVSALSSVIATMVDNGAADPNIARHLQANHTFTPEVRARIDETIREKYSDSVKNGKEKEAEYRQEILDRLSLPQ